MKLLTLGRTAIVLALATAALSLVSGDHDQAETSVGAFYSRVQKADFEGARKSIEEAIRLWPANARYYAWRGYAASQELPSQCPAHGIALNARTREQVQSAAADYRHALELNGRDAVAHHNLAWLDHLMGHDEEARHEWARAIAIDPETAMYHLSLGFFLEETGDSVGARRQYVAAIELTPVILDSPFFTRYRARFPGRAEAVVTEAMADLESRLKGAGDPILKARLGKLWLFRGDLARATDLLESAAKDLPNLPMVWFNLAEVRRLQGNGAQAWECYGKARLVDGSMAGPYLRLGEIYRDTGQTSLAVGYLRSAAQKWARVNPITAAHNNRLYGGLPQPIDDLLPTTLVWFTTDCQASEAYGLLASLVPENKVYRARSRTCEDLPSPHPETNPVAR